MKWKAHSVHKTVQSVLDELSHPVPGAIRPECELYIRTVCGDLDKVSHESDVPPVRRSAWSCCCVEPETSETYLPPV